MARQRLAQVFTRYIDGRRLGAARLASAECPELRLPAPAAPGLECRMIATIVIGVWLAAPEDIAWTLVRDLVDAGDRLLRSASSVGRGA